MSAAADLQTQLAALAPGWCVRVVPTVDSTNSALLRQAQGGDLHPTLLLADQQTAGRGRLGRRWVSTDARQALTFSLGLPLAPHDWSGLSLVIGVVLAESMHPQVQLKWPNDLYWQGRKLGGILIETCTAASLPQGRYVVVGVGINLLPPPAVNGDVAAACLHECSGDPSRATLLARLLPPLMCALKDFADQGFAPWQSRFAARDALRGLEIAVSDGRCGQALGVAQDGSLRLDTAAGEVHIRSGELSLRPRPQALVAG